MERQPATSHADLAERWRPWRALAVAHLWMAESLQGEKLVANAR
jgi:3-methyladenine DNA glycosylase/8-oxoguanine DNA glycosylase